MKQAQRKDLTKRGHFRTYAYLRDFNRTTIDDPLPEHELDRNLQFRFHREPIEITETSVKFRINPFPEHPPFPENHVLST